MAKDTAKAKKADETVPEEQAPAKAGGHLGRRIKRNSELTEEAMRNPTGGAHSGTPEPNNP